MKKIALLFTCLLTAAVVYCQNLDTVVVRNLTMQAQDWAYFAGKNASNTDSVTVKAVRMIRAEAQENVPGSWTANMTVDSLPGETVVGMYRQLLRSDEGEVVARYTAIRNAIIAKTNLTVWLQLEDARAAAEFIRKRDLGRRVLLDQ